MIPAITEPLFYLPELPAADQAVLTDAEARHAAAQRLRAGDPVAVFDGRGRAARGRIAAVARNAVRIEVAQRIVAHPPRPALDLYAAVPKGDRQATLLDMATQLGMTRFVPVTWTHSVVEPGARARERWERICIEACKQSRRLHVPEVRAPAWLPEAVAAARAEHAQLLLAHPACDARPVLALAHARAAPYALFVGPEGGVTDAEAQLLRDNGASLVSLGDSILRVEAAAIALLALVRAVADTATGAG